MKQANGPSVQLGWWEMTIIKVAGMTCLPVLIVGAEIGKKHGLVQAAVAIMLGNLILFILGFANCQMAIKNRHNTMENAVTYFGQYGAKLFALNMSIGLTGWFAIQLNVMGLSAQKMTGLIFHGSFSLPSLFYNIALGMMITAVSFYGISGLNKLSKMSAPLLVSTVLYALYLVHLVLKSRLAQSLAALPPINPAFDSFTPFTPFSSIHPDVQSIGFSFQAVSLVMATAIAAIIDLPTYYRHSKTLKDGRVALFLSFIICLPILEFVGAYIAANIPGDNLVDIFSGIGGHLWKIWVCFFLIFAGWTINNTNLYSASVAFEQIGVKNNAGKRSLLIGFAGTLLSCFSFINSFAPMLSAMGIMMSSMGAVVISNYLYNQYLLKEKETYEKSHYMMNIISWLIGTVFGFLNFFKIMSLTQVELIDAFIVSVMMTIILLFQRKKLIKIKWPTQKNKIEVP